MNQAVLALDEQQLIAAAQQHDPASLAQLCERYYPQIYRYAVVKTGNPSDAEDVTQETFARMVGKLGRFRWQGVPFGAWLLRIANNCATDVHRARRKQEGLANRAPHETPIDDPADLAALHLEAQEAADAVERLSHAQQAVLQLRFGAQLSVADTAKALGKAEGTVKATQFQALQALRTAMARSAHRAASKRKRLAARDRLDPFLLRPAPDSRPAQSGCG